VFVLSLSRVGASYVGRPIFVCASVVGIPPTRLRRVNKYTIRLHAGYAIYRDRIVDMDGVT
jgi:hypothetical protein